MQNDPYFLSQEKILIPPKTFRDRLKYLGPSLILSAAIVGSGELIATTTLGAKAGFVCFWIILVSCAVKVMVQLEFGKHTVSTGETSMQIMSQLPGPKINNTRWSVWLVFIIMIFKLLQVGGIVGGVAITLNMVFSQIPVPVFAFLVATMGALLVYKGYYQSLEKLSLFMIAFFTIFTFSSLYFLKYTTYQISWENIKEGLSFKLPKAALAFAFGAFGITGVGGDEIIHYNYWCLEKGYASHVGPRDESEDWKNRVAGWVKVMQLDAFLAMLIYTSVTAAFYLLGAAVLHQQATLPEGYQMIEVLSQMFTESLGPWSKVFFLGGAFVILFSTVFAALAAWTRQFADIFGQMQWVDFSNMAQRKKLIARLAWVLPFLWAFLFVFIKLPMIMVVSGGIVGSFLLILVLWAVIYNKYFRMNDVQKSTGFYNILLWISICSILAFCIYGILQIF
ncbi:divalent metal cation transporter [Lacihabitans sp. LS3-19]|uniref:Nramp family divalent metal transporter n=1 Tax=Lacihabitans sp. LS3-19 TaxID=2487335 RepID=UPI0020CC133F|nr:Nramp family divalent metal transporter [Lacihabitans sp. LS3-19]MCP9766423.1 divalent metal cation transporter [Lacihabitans sp. LS3-19]